MKDLLPQILAYVSSPFKLFAIVIMAVLTFMGYFVWQNQEVMIGAYSKSQELPKMNADKYESSARLILKNTNALGVVIFSVDPILGKRIVQSSYLADGSRYKDFDGHDIGLFSKNKDNNRDVVALMAGDMPCNEYKEAQSEIGFWYKSIGANYTCRISVPPEQHQFIGQITVLFKEPVDNVETLLNVASSMLVRK